jgi:hypothetical protein
MFDGSGPPAWWVAGVVCIIVAGVVSFIVRATVLRQGGLRPFAAREQLEAKLARELDRRSASPPPRTVEERLTELDDLHRRGVISDQERHDARAKVLSDGA